MDMVWIQDWRKIKRGVWKRVLERALDSNLERIWRGTFSGFWKDMGRIFEGFG